MEANAKKGKKIEKIEAKIRFLEIFLKNSNETNLKNEKIDLDSKRVVRVQGYREAQRRLYLPP